MPQTASTPAPGPAPLFPKPPGVTLGIGLTTPSPELAQICANSGFDFVMIDMEHGAFDLETIADLAGWFAATTVSPIVRIHKAFIHLIPAILDQGIMGIQISDVDNAEEARAIVQQAKYPPIGNRGISQMGPHTGYRSYGARYQTEYSPWANENVIICPSIESLEGLENVELVCPVSTKPYIYNPEGIFLQDRNELLIVYDATNSHKGFRWAITVHDPQPFQPLVTKVIALPESFFLLHPPNKS